jgi:hypothetical protein
MPRSEWRPHHPPLSAGPGGIANPRTSSRPSEHHLWVIGRSHLLAADGDLPYGHVGAAPGRPHGSTLGRRADRTDIPSPARPDTARPSARRSSSIRTSHLPSECLPFRPWPSPTAGRPSLRPSAEEGAGCRATRTGSSRCPRPRPGRTSAGCPRDREAHFAGWSAGGNALIEFALAYPRRVRTVTLVEPGAYWILEQLSEADPNVERTNAFMHALSGKDVTEDDLAAFLELAGFVSSKEEARSHPIWERWVIAPNGALLVLGGPRPIRTVDRGAANFRCPVLLVNTSGGCQDAIQGGSEGLPILGADFAALATGSTAAGHVGQRGSPPGVAGRPCRVDEDDCKEAGGGTCCR